MTSKPGSDLAPSRPLHETAPTTRRAPRAQARVRTLAVRGLEGITLQTLVVDYRLDTPDPTMDGTLVRLAGRLVEERTCPESTRFVTTRRATGARRMSSVRIPHLAAGVWEVTVTPVVDGRREPVGEVRVTGHTSDPLAALALTALTSRPRRSGVPRPAWTDRRLRAVPRPLLGASVLAVLPWYAAFILTLLR